MKKIIIMLLTVIFGFSFSPVYVKAVTTTTTTLITSENNPELWERFLKYDLCILDYDSLDDEQKDLCKFIFETELNSDDTIICERARRILNGYDVGRRVTLEDTENYYDFGDPAFLYKHVLPDTPYFYAVPDIKHIDSDVNYNEYWLDNFGNKKILSTGEAINSDNTDFLDIYKYIEKDESNNIITDKDIRRYSIHFKTIEDDNFIYVIYPDNTLYVKKMKSNTAYPIVPEEVNGMKVIGIKDNVFEGHAYVLKLPDTIEYIEPLAFDYCNYLRSVNIPDNLRYLGAGAFHQCESLENISIDCPNLIIVDSAFQSAKIDGLFINVKFIKSCVLRGAERLNNLSFGSNVIKLGTLWANSKFMKDWNYTIPANVKAITNDYFPIYNDYYPDDLIIPETVEVFGAYSTSVKKEENGNNILFVIDDNEWHLSSDTIISGYYGTEAHNYALLHNIKFKPLDDILYGDTNKDEKINIADLVLLQDYLLHNSTIDYEADMNKDGRINVFDLISIKKYITKNIEE